MDIYERIIEDHHTQRDLAAKSLKTEDSSKER